MPARPKPELPVAARVPRCPICRKPVGVDGELFPFCGRRCKLVDLGRWLDEDYRIEVPIDETDRDLPPAAESPEREDAS